MLESPPLAHWRDWPRPTGFWSDCEVRGQFVVGFFFLLKVSRIFWLLYPRVSWWCALMRDVCFLCWNFQHGRSRHSWWDISVLWWFTPLWYPFLECPPVVCWNSWTGSLIFCFPLLFYFLGDTFNFSCPNHLLSVLFCPYFLRALFCSLKVHFWNRLSCPCFRVGWS